MSVNVNKKTVDTLQQSLPTVFIKIQMIVYENKIIYVLIM